jgi:GR25 family glycosyltransferase involved in LPS biosynthesis
MFHQNYPIYCINLKTREDRKKNAIDNFKKLDIDNVSFPDFYKDIRGGSYGCYSSHIYIWKDFYNKYPDYKYCLIFEDDFKLTKKSKKYIKLGEKFIEKNYNIIDILNLHNFGAPIDNEINNKRFTNGFGFGTHVYFINRLYIDKIYNDMPEPSRDHIDFSINYDLNSVLYSKKIFFTKNTCFLQIEDNTDNNWNFTNLSSNEFILLTKNINSIVNIFIDNSDIKNIYMFANNLIK